MKHKKSLPLKISMISSLVAIVAVAALALAVPSLSRLYISGAGLQGDAYTLRYATVIALSYIGLVPVVVSDLMLIKLLRLVGSAEIFAARSAGILQNIALCCFAELVPVIALAFFMEAYGVCMIPLAFVGLFLGAVLMVVKDVIIRGAELKTENDFTV